MRLLRNIFPRYARRRNAADSLSTVSLWHYNKDQDTFSSLAEQGPRKEFRRSLIFILLLIGTWFFQIPLVHAVSAPNLQTNEDNPDIEVKTDLFTPAVYIKEVNFFQNKKNLLTKTSNYNEVFIKNNTDILKIEIKGQVFGMKNPKILSILLPSQTQKIHEPGTDDFTVEISIDEFQLNTAFYILLSGINDSEKTPFHTLDFILKPDSEYPTTNVLLFQTLQSKSMTLMLILLSILLAFFVLFTALEGKLMKFFLSALLVLLFLGSSGFVIVKDLVPKLIPLDRTTVAKTAPDKEPLALTEINEQGEMVPKLARSWSQISPMIWEFNLIDPLPAALAVEDLRQKISDHPLLSTVNDITFDLPIMRIKTDAPDPLLARKLSKVDFTPPVAIDESSLPVLNKIPQTSNTQKTRFIKNPLFVDLPFIEDRPIFETTIREENPESLKKLIAEKTITEFDEPDPSLWPLLSMNGYRIIPKINTEIAVLMTNRKSTLFKNPLMITALRKMLVQNRLLETSYFQFGRIGTQFAPAGVFGYDPDLKISDDGKSAEQTFEESKNSLGISEVRMFLHYPKQEKKLAAVIEQLLEREGIIIIPKEIETKDFEKALTKGLPDLLLLPIRFDLFDIGPFLDAFIDSTSRFNQSYLNAKADELIQQSRTELRDFERLKILREIMKIITIDDPAGMPILFKKSFVAVKKDQEKLPWYVKLFLESFPDRNANADINRP